MRSANGDWNTRYAAYARAHGYSNPQWMLEADGRMLHRYIAWVSKHWNEWRSETGCTRVATEEDHAAFDAWLERQVAR